MAITVQGPTGVFQPSYPDIIDKYGVVTNMFTSSFKEYFTSSGAASYSVNKSLRFRSSASAYLNRTPATAGTGVGKTWTWSGWIKRGTIASSNLISLMHGQTSGGSTDRGGFGFYTYAGAGAGSDSFTLYYGAAFANNLTTTQVFRDPAAWYHFVLAVDTTQATAANRALLYVNGIQITSFSAANYPTLNYQFAIGNNVAQWLCSEAGSGYFFDGELAEVNFVDGQALAPTLFGASSIYNQWLPIAYAGTYGTNGFYLPFTNTASTSTLVADSSGNANNWTPNNISLTAGSTYDSLTDVPTLTSTTVANYAVLNPLDAATTTGVASNGNLSWTNSAATHQCIRGSIAIPATGAYYFEAINVTSNNATIGMALGLGASTASLTVNMGGGQANVFSWYSGGNANSYLISGTTTLATFVGGAFVANDVLQLAVDTTNTKMWLGKNNVWYNSTGGTTGNPTTGANPTFTTSMVGLFPMTEVFTNTVHINFGQQPFTYTPPTGFLPLNTFNI